MKPKSRLQVCFFPETNLRSFSSGYCQILNILYFPATHEQIDKAKEMINNLKFKFSSENFENPSKLESLFIPLKLSY